MYGKFLADVITVIHGLLVVILLLGTLVFVSGLTKKYRWFRVGYYLAAVSTALSYFFTHACFLATWEIYLRDRYDLPNTYDSGFVYHYINKFLGVELSSDFVFYLFVAAFAIVVISDLFWSGGWRIKHKS